jgi:hypothetical protein
LTIRGDAVVERRKRNERRCVTVLTRRKLDEEKREGEAVIVVGGRNLFKAVRVGIKSLPVCGVVPRNLRDPGSTAGLLSSSHRIKSGVTTQPDPLFP